LSIVKVQGNASGTGIFTVAAPNSNTDRTLTLPDNTGTILTTGTAGVPVNGPAFSAYNNSAQSISSGTFTKIQVNAEEFDTNSNFDIATNYRFTPTVAGYYQINANVTNGGASFGSNGFMNVYIYKNGSAYKSSGQQPANGNYAMAFCSSVIYCNGSTDYLEMYVLSSASFTTVNSSLFTFFSGAMVRGA
jgi:hypothetical protein